MGFRREAINVLRDIYNVCEEMMAKIKDRGLRTGLGGGICKYALPAIKKLDESGLLDKFETRKVVFPAESWKYGDDAILKAVEFELLWLKSKRRYYSRVKAEDEKRIAMLEARLEANAVLE